MNFQEHKPNFFLDNVIDSIWEFSHLEKEETMRILPDGCSDIIINLGDVPSIFISGIMTSYTDNTFSKQTNLIGIRFKEGKLGEFTDAPISETKDSQIEAVHFFPFFHKTLLSQLNDANNFFDKKLQIETLLSQSMLKKKKSSHQLIDSIIHTIKNSSENINLNSIAKNHFISLRQLERKFKYQVGVTMKEFHRIIRFKKVHRAIIQSKNPNFSKIANQFGFHDYSHLSYEIKKFTGQSVSKLK